MNPTSAYKRNLASYAGIPLKQAHLINVTKAKQYFEWLYSPEGQIEKFLDDRCLFHLECIKKEQM